MEGGRPQRRTPAARSGKTWQAPREDQAKKHKGNLRLDSRESILKGGDTGPAVVPGRPEESLLVKAVRYQDAQLQMPPSRKLPDAEVAVLIEWVRRGAPFPGGGGVKS